MKLPNDPFILLSFVNTLLRDKYKSLSELCDDHNINADTIVTKLEGIGYTYSAEQNRFK